MTIYSLIFFPGKSWNANCLFLCAFILSMVWIAVDWITHTLFPLDLHLNYKPCLWNKVLFLCFLTLNHFINTFRECQWHWNSSSLGRFWEPIFSSMNEFHQSINETSSLFSPGIILFLYSFICSDIDPYFLILCVSANPLTPIKLLQEVWPRANKLLVNSLIPSATDPRSLPSEVCVMSSGWKGHTHTRAYTETSTAVTVWHFFVLHWR